MFINETWCLKNHFKLTASGEVHHKNYHIIIIIIITTIMHAYSLFSSIWFNGSALRYIS